MGLLFSESKKAYLLDKVSALQLFFMKSYGPNKFCCVKIARADCCVTLPNLLFVSLLFYELVAVPATF